MITHTDPALAAERIGTTAEYVRLLCRTGRVPGALRFGRAWLVPVEFNYERLRAGRKAKAPK